MARTNDTQKKNKFKYQQAKILITTVVIHIKT